jgi:hypothetical protein
MLIAAMAGVRTQLAPEWTAIASSTTRMGNALGAAGMGAIGYYLSNGAVFYLTAALGLPAIKAQQPAVGQQGADAVLSGRARRLLRRGRLLEHARMPWATPSARPGWARSATTCRTAPCST